MKWIFCLMVLVNLGYFGWQYTRVDSPTRPSTAVMPPAGAQRLALLSEVDVGALRERRVPEIAGPPKPAMDAVTTIIDAGSAASTQGPICLSVGPLRSDRDIEEVGDWLRREGGSLELRVGERREITLYWIFIPPFETAVKANEEAIKLRAQGIDDIAVIPGGDMANAISLGVYSRRTTLERRLAELHELGHDPSLVPRFRTQQASWFDVRFPEGSEFPEAIFGERFPDSEASLVDCA